MNEHSSYLVQAARGPIILITIGVLFAFDRFTEFRFSQTWPVLLIVLGLLRLAGGSRRAYRDYWAQQQVHPASGRPAAAPLHNFPPAGAASSESMRYAGSPYSKPAPPPPAGQGRGARQ